MKVGPVQFSDLEVQMPAYMKKKGTLESNLDSKSKCENSTKSKPE